MIMMTDGISEVIAKVKTLTKKKLVEQNSSATNANYKSSAIWSEIPQMLNYMQNLSPEDFLNIRYHCDPFSGLGLMRDIQRRIYGLYSKDLPDNLQPLEPETHNLPFTLDLKVRYTMLNGSIVRCRLCVNYLYNSEAYSAIEQHKSCPSIIEIGGGNGGLSHSLRNYFASKINYTLNDLPKKFLLQLPLITINNPQANIYIHETEALARSFIHNDLENYNFIILANFDLKKLKELKAILLLINILFFQEITVAQVEEYLSFAGECSECGIYSDNCDCHQMNSSDMSSVTKHLEEKFSLFHDAKLYWDKVPRREVIKDFVKFRHFMAVNTNSLQFINSVISEVTINLEKKVKALPLVDSNYYAAFCA